MRDFDLEQFISKYNIAIKKKEILKDKIKYILNECPFNCDHTAPDAAIFQFNDGKLGFKCFHDSCSGKGWKDFRMYYEPGAYDESNTYQRIDRGYKAYKYSKSENTPKETTDTLPPFVSWDSVCDNLPQLPPTIIDGVLRQGEELCLTGKSKAGKSFMLMQLAFAISEGRRWLNYFYCDLGKVLYINFEIGESHFYHRLDNIATSLKWDFHHKDNLIIWNLRGENINPDTLTTELINRIKEDDYKVVIVDPIYKMFDGDENNNEEVKSFLKCLNAICKETNTSVIYCHHQTKGSQAGKDIIDRASGSGAFGRDADAVIDVEQVQIDIKAAMRGGLDPSVRMFRFNSCLRNFPPQDDLLLMFKHPIHWIDKDRRYEEYIAKKRSKNTKTDSENEKDSLEDTNEQLGFTEDEVKKVDIKI